MRQNPYPCSGTTYSTGTGPVRRQPQGNKGLRGCSFTSTQDQSRSEKLQDSKITKRAFDFQSERKLTSLNPQCLEEQDPYDPLLPGMHPVFENSFQIQNRQNFQDQSEFFYSQSASNTIEVGSSKVVLSCPAFHDAPITVQPRNLYDAMYGLHANSTGFQSHDQKVTPELVQNPTHYCPSRSGNLHPNLSPAHLSSEKRLHWSMMIKDLNESSNCNRVLREKEFQYEGYFQEESTYSNNSYSDFEGLAAVSSYSRTRTGHTNKHSGIMSMTKYSPVPRDPDFNYGSYYPEVSYPEESNSGCNPYGVSTQSVDRQDQGSTGSTLDFSRHTSSSSGDLLKEVVPRRPVNPSVLQASLVEGVLRRKLYRGNPKQDYHSKNDWRNYAITKPTPTPKKLIIGDECRGEIQNTPDKLYHYTSADGAFGILGDRCIIMKGGCKRFGIGIYFTDLPPETSSAEIAFSNYRSSTDEMLLRTEYCFEFPYKSIPGLELCREVDRRSFWKAGVRRVALEKNFTYYCRKLRGPDVPFSVEPFTIDF